MKQLLDYILSFVKEHFNLKLYIAFAVFVTALIAFNYTYNFERSVINSYYGKDIRILFMALMHASAFYGVIIIVAITTGRNHLRSGTFWVKSALGLLVLGVYRGFTYYRELCDFFPRIGCRFVLKVSHDVGGVLIALLGLGIIYWIFDRKQDKFYGINNHKFDARPYWVMLAVMVPLLLSASFLEHFTDFYPRYQRSGGVQFANAMGWPEWLAIVVYEVTYAIGFFEIELFFRGFLVIGLARHLGKDGVLAMAATYAVLHFGKPMGETISSVFGGYILGILALTTRNIWGGVWIHVSIALLMELFAFVQLSLK